jgi:hypothetical protein
MYVQYILDLYQPTLSTADHAPSSVVYATTASRHLNGRTVDRRQV